MNKQSADYFIPIVNWILVNGNIPYQYLRLFSVTESFFLLTVIFNYMIETSEREYTYGEVFMRFCIMYLFFEFIMTTSGVRYGFAVCQYIYALHLVFNKKSWLPALFFALFATQIHVSFAFFIPISVLLYWLCSTKRKTIVFFGLLSVVLIPIISHFSYLLGRRADWYFGGGNSVSDNSAITIYGFILTIGVRLFLLPFLVLVYQYFTPPPYTHAHQSRNTKSLMQMDAYGCGVDRDGCNVHYQYDNAVQTDICTFHHRHFPFTGNRTALLHKETVYNNSFMVRNNDNSV